MADMTFALVLLGAIVISGVILPAAFRFISGVLEDMEDEFPW